MNTYSFGTAPAEEITRALKGEHYPMNLRGADAEVVHRAVNQGIDSHLEVCFLPSRGDSFEVYWDLLKCNVSPESMLVLLRRLFENGADEAWGLRSSILDTLGIEEV